MNTTNQTSFLGTGKITIAAIIFFVITSLNGIGMFIMIFFMPLTALVFYSAEENVKIAWDVLSGTLLLISMFYLILFQPDYSSKNPSVLNKIINSSPSASEK